jgi:hypothetical protein
MAGTLESRGICIIRPCGRQAANDAWAVSMTEIEFAEDSNCMPVAAVSSVSAELRGNPHLTRRWPYGRVTEGLPTTQAQKRGNNNARPIKQFFVWMPTESAASGQYPPDTFSSPRPPYRQA